MNVSTRTAAAIAATPAAVRVKWRDARQSPRFSAWGFLFARVVALLLRRLLRRLLFLRLLCREFVAQ